MRAYCASDEEALLVRSELKDWGREGLLTEAQCRRMDEETVCNLRRTNVFLRLVLFLFTIVIVAGTTALLSMPFTSNATLEPLGLLLLIFAAASYAAAEFAVSRGLYRYGVEEALAVCSVALLCAGTFAICSTNHGSPKSNGTEFMVPMIGALASLGIWYRFGFAYVFAATMLFIPWLSSCWTSSRSSQHLLVAAFYTAGLISVLKVRSPHRFDYLNERYSITEAFLWLGMYAAFNLQLSTIDPLRQSWGGPRDIAAFSGTFYWATWILTWFIPPVALLSGLRRKDRFVIAVGGLTAVLTLITNKSYLGWHRQTWDPMLLGALLIGIALSLHRWFSKAPGGIRHGFTAQRLSGKDKRWISAVSVAFGLASPHSTIINPRTSDREIHFGGGDFGGGGAASNF